PHSAATLAEILRDNGYATFAAGKWHLAPMAECSAAGPFSNWPLQKGFDRYYGFLQGETDQFFPELTCDNHFVDAPGGPEDGYHLSEDIVDRATLMIRDLKSLVPERRYFLYLAFGAMHSPHQAPKSYLEKYRGLFDEGWDVVRERWFERQKALGIIPPETRLAPRNPGVKPWTDLSVNERKFAARLQEAFAAMLEHTDVQIGRLVSFLKEMGEWENTLFILLSDNGASQEGGQTGVLDEMKWFNGMAEDVDAAVERLDDIGGPNSHCNIPWGWAQAGNSPLKWYKQNTHGGGVRDPLILHWPGKISAAGEIRRQFCHAIDIAPTVLELASIAPPDSVAGVAQMPIHGRSLAALLGDGEARLARDAQYFEMLGHRGIWKDGWKAVTRHKSGTPYEEDRWELYHLDKDFSEFEDLAEKEPAKLKEMVALWWEQARLHGVLPLDDRPGIALFRASMRPGLPSSRTHFVYRPPVSHLVAEACPSLARGLKATVEFNHPQGASGALFARGSINSGLILCVRDGRLSFDYNCFHSHSVITAARELKDGAHRVELAIEPDNKGGARVSIACDGALVAEGAIPKLLFMLSSTGMDIGRSLSPVSQDYEAPFAYPGTIHLVTFDTARQKRAGEDRAAVRSAIAQQ
ncbi:MAG: arylsulfatase, partial [Alphaproteobacteria bacterium]|nr:arylsulfatase [Alphaproteobacteria bacterium]